MGMNYTPKSIFFATFGTVWTVCLLSGMGFLWWKRNLPFVKVRGIGLSFVAIAFLHAYYLAIQYCQLWTSFPEQVEYWVMGVYLPVGIALFHASNSRFLHVAEQQRRFVGQGLETERHNWFERKLGLGRLRFNTRIMITIGVGMGIQIFFIVLMYLLSRKFHPSFGIPGTEVSGDPWEVNSKQAVGWEWWPSIVWQFLWSWVFAPVVLFRARKIHDTLGWRTQTIACCIANLPATPMWLISLYVPGMRAVSAYWLPPEWLSTSIVFLELFTVFVPCWQAYRHKHLRQETLDMITAWEQKKPAGESHSQDASSSSSSSSTLKASWTMSSTLEKLGQRESCPPPGSSYSGESLLSMGAMEHLLQNNPEPLRHFSALKDFSGENVAFLTAVAAWKKSCADVLAAADNDHLPEGQQQKHVLDDQAKEEATRDAYTRALCIYTDFISLRDADFPINISSKDTAKLETVFEKAARILFGRNGLADNVTPFGAPGGLAQGSGMARQLRSERPVVNASSSSSSTTKDTATELRSMVKRISYWGEIPAEFDIDIFDQAEANIKYLVLTNTWPKFVQERRLSDGSLMSLVGEDEQDEAERGAHAWGASFSRMIACGKP